MHWYHSQHVTATYFKHYCFAPTADNAAIQMVVATMNVTENVAGGSVSVCAEITGVSGMLECVVSNRARLSSKDKKAST